MPHYEYWWEREEAQSNCSHMMREWRCINCYGFEGESCDLCGFEWDGGDAKQSYETGCTCEDGPTFPHDEDSN